MKRIVIFTALAFGLVWVPCFLMIFGILPTEYMLVVFAGCMLMPAVASLLTRLITREGFGEMKLRPHLKGHAKIYLAAWFAPSLLIAAGAVLWYLLNPAQFDPTMTAAAVSVKMEPAQLRQIILLQLLVGVLLGPAINFIPALGEELGWRGYLLPRLMQQTSPRKAIVISGIIWGLWHAPMIALGHNYGQDYIGYPWLGIAAMTVFCVALGALLGWMALKADSAIPCAMAHAGLNACGAGASLFAVGSTNPLIGPMPTGIIGGMGFLIVGGVLLATIKQWLPKATIEAEN